MSWLTRQCYGEKRLKHWNKMPEKRSSSSCHQTNIFSLHRGAFTLQLTKLFSPPEFSELIISCYSTLEWFNWMEKLRIFYSKTQARSPFLPLLWCLSRSCHLELEMMSPLLLSLLLVTGQYRLVATHKVKVCFWKRCKMYLHDSKVVRHVKAGEEVMEPAMRVSCAMWLQNSGGGRVGRPSQGPPSCLWHSFASGPPAQSLTIQKVATKKCSKQNQNRRPYCCHQTSWEIWSLPLSTTMFSMARNSVHESVRKLCLFYKGNMKWK